MGSSEYNGIIRLIPWLCVICNWKQCLCLYNAKNVILLPYLFVFAIDCYLLYTHAVYIFVKRGISPFSVYYNNSYPMKSLYFLVSKHFYVLNRRFFLQKANCARSELAELGVNLVMTYMMLTRLHLHFDSVYKRLLF